MASAPDLRAAATIALDRQIAFARPAPRRSATASSASRQCGQLRSASVKTATVRIAHAPRRADDAAGDLAAIGDEEGAEHRAFLGRPARSRQIGLARRVVIMRETPGTGYASRCSACPIPSTSAPHRSCAAALCAAPAHRLGAGPLRLRAVPFPEPRARHLEHRGDGAVQAWRTAVTRSLAGHDRPRRGARHPCRAEPLEDRAPLDLAAAALGGGADRARADHPGAPLRARSRRCAAITSCSTRRRAIPRRCRTSGTSWRCAQTAAAPGRLGARLHRPAFLAAARPLLSALAPAAARARGADPGAVARRLRRRRPRRRGSARRQRRAPSGVRLSDDGYGALRRLAAPAAEPLISDPMLEAGARYIAWALLADRGVASGDPRAAAPRRAARIRISYTAGPSFVAPAGPTLLELSRMAACRTPRSAAAGRAARPAASGSRHSRARCRRRTRRRRRR